MPFMVIYRTSDGSSCFEQADAIDEAALFVERLRNQEGIDEIRIYRMEEISFAFRPYYKVELGMADRQSVPTPPAASTAVVIEGPPPAPESSPASGDAEPSAASPAAVEVAPDDVTDVRVESNLPAPPPPVTDAEHAGANGRRGLFGR
jgi:hypothetical protein